MTQAITVVPVDAKTPDWPRKVAQVLNRLQNTTALAGASAAWGSITGTLSAQTDLQAALNAKGTVSSVAATVPTGFSIAGSPITTTGTLAISYSAGYSLPTDANQANWTTAFGWGNHATAGYLTTAAAAAAYQPLDAQLTDLAGLSYAGNANKVVRVNAGATAFELATVSGGSLADGDYGDITVGGGGTTLTIDSDVVTYAKMQNVSATSRILGRKTSGAGDTEECTLSEVLDFVGSAAQGDILYRGASGWARLGAGTSGQALVTQGGGANPAWTTLAPQYSFGSNTTGGASTSLYAGKGAIVVSTYALQITKLWQSINVGNTSHSYTGYILELNSSNVVQALTGTSSAVVPGATGSQIVSFNFASPVTLAAGTRYALIVYLTNATATTSSGAAAGSGVISGFPEQLSSTFARHAATAPVVGNTIDSGANQFSIGAVFRLT